MTDHAEFHQAIGHALIKWSEVEQCLCELFVYATTMQMGNTAVRAAYWKIASFDARLNMVDAALQDAFADHPGLREKWETLNNRLGDKNKKRNILAHSALIDYHKKGKAFTKLLPFMYGRFPIHAKEDFKQGLSISDVRTMSEIFDKLGKDVYKLSREVLFDHIQGPYNRKEQVWADIPAFKRPQVVKENE